MIETDEKVFKCQFCGYSSTRDVIDDHEPECKRRYERQKEEARIYREKITERLRQATEFAKNNGAVKLLCANGFTHEAETICREWARWNLWNSGISSDWESLCRAMVDAANGDMPK